MIASAVRPLPDNTDAALAELHAAGFRDGPPAHLPPAALSVDNRCARALKCPGCKRRSLEYRPLHKGRQYRALACCRRCPCCEEV